MPSPLSTKVTPEGSAPVSLSAATGNPVVVTVNVPAMPTANDVVAGLVIAGAAWFTTYEKAVEVLVVKFVSPE